MRAVDISPLVASLVTFAAYVAVVLLVVRRAAIAARIRRWLADGRAARAEVQDFWAVSRHPEQLAEPSRQRFAGGHPSLGLHVLTT